MSFGNLAAEDKPNAGAPRLGGEEGHKQIGGVGKARTVIDDPQLHLPALSRPANLHSSLRFQGGIGGIANQVYQ